MAIPIRDIPVLTGQAALDFVNEAEKYADRPVPHLSEEDEEMLRQVRESGKNFVW